MTTGKIDASQLTNAEIADLGISQIESTLTDADMDDLEIDNVHTESDNETLAYRIHTFAPLVKVGSDEINRLYEIRRINMKTILKVNGLSKTSFAASLGVSPQQLSQYLSDKHATEPAAYKKGYRRMPVEQVRYSEKLFGLVGGYLDIDHSGEPVPSLDVSNPVSVIFSTPLAAPKQPARAKPTLFQIPDNTWEIVTKLVLNKVLGSDNRLTGIIDTIALVAGDASDHGGVVNEALADRLIGRLI